MLTISDRVVGPNHPPYIIAELGVNHDGDPGRAIKLLEMAHHAGADAIKLQFFKTDQLLSSAARLAAYQSRVGETDPIAMLRRLELDIESMQRIVTRAKHLSMHAIVTLFSVEMIAEARTIDWDAYKTASPDIINRPLIEGLMSTGLPLIVSTGAASLEEIRLASGWLGEYPHLLMHCVSSYPTPDESAALGGRLAMLEVSPRALGYSDHTMSVDTGAMAVASGACLLEKHLTDDRNAPGPDHASSLDGEGFAEYVRLAHRAAKMLGSIEKRVLECEIDVRDVARQSITTRRDLPAGHELTREDLTIKRPGIGISPAEFDMVLGRKLVQPVEADLPLLPEHLQ